MKLLVLTPEPVDAELLRAALGDEVEGAEVLVVSPATNQSKLAFWVSDPDEAIAEAEAAQEETVERLEEAGVDAAGDTGESEPARRAGGRAGDLRGRPDRRLLAPRGRARLPRGRGPRGRRGALRRPGHARPDRPLNRFRTAASILTGRTTNQFVLVLVSAWHDSVARRDGLRLRRRRGPGASGARTPHPDHAGPRAARAAQANSVTASQARAAHRREARRDEQAVAAWLRELAGRTR